MQTTEMLMLIVTPCVTGFTFKLKQLIIEKITEHRDTPNQPITVGLFKLGPDRHTPTHLWTQISVCSFIRLILLLHVPFQSQWSRVKWQMKTQQFLILQLQNKSFEALMTEDFYCGEFKGNRLHQLVWPQPHIYSMFHQLHTSASSV